MTTPRPFETSFRFDVLCRMLLSVCLRSALTSGDRRWILLAVHLRIMTSVLALSR